MRLGNVGYVIGAVILIVSAFVYARASISQNDSYTEPLAVPVSLVLGFDKTFDVATKIDRNFELVIDVQQSRLKASPLNINVTWQILDGGAVVAQGSSVDKPWQNWWGTFEQQLGTFPGRAGRHYTLKLQANQAVAQLDSAGPILKVRIPRDDWEGYGAGVAIEKLESAVLGFIGLAIVGCAFLLRHHAQTQRAAESET